jgi:predicted MPP superfamily phosphohydrolase
MRNKLFFFVFVFLAGLAIDIFYEVNFPKVNRIEIKSEKIAAGQEVKVVQITDLHDKKFFDNQVQIYDKIRQENPDFIVLTGDIIDRSTRDYSYVYSFIDNLKKINSRIYFIPGNHELSHEDIGDFIKQLEEKGVVVAGADPERYQTIDIYGAKYYDDIPKAVAPKRFSLLLVHDPSFVIKNGGSFDLILAGHTHGGQVRLPFVGAVYAPGQGIFPRYSKGLFDVNGTELYIDSGLGSTFLPIRFMDQSQFSVIDLVSK